MQMVTKRAGRTIAAGQFKARCLALIEEVGKTRQPITITKRGRPVAQIVPLDQQAARPLFGFHSGHVIMEGDLVSPTGERWDADA